VWRQGQKPTTSWAEVVGALVEPSFEAWFKSDWAGEVREVEGEEVVLLPPFRVGEARLEVTPLYLSGAAVWLPDRKAPASPIPVGWLRENTLSKLAFLLEAEKFLKRGGNQ